MDECAAYFTKLWNERVNAEPRNDLISMMAHNDATRHMDPDNLMGNIILLIVGGNDTTRNTMSGSVLALNENPDQYQKLRDNPALIDSMVPEVIRWQTPLAHMRRTALVDTEIGGKKIRKGDRVVMWYVSGNRDEEGIEKPERIHHRPRPAPHPSVVRLRHPPLRRHAARRTAAEDRVAGDAEALRPDRGGRRAEAGLFQLRARHRMLPVRIPHERALNRQPCRSRQRQRLRHAAGFALSPPGYAEERWRAGTTSCSSSAIFTAGHHRAG